MYGRKYMCERLFVSLHLLNFYRSKLESRNSGAPEGAPVAPVRTGSGSHSNDSGVALLLERAHHAFNTDHTASPTPTNHRASDQVSLVQSCLFKVSIFLITVDG